MKRSVLLFIVFIAGFASLGDFSKRALLVTSNPSLLIAGDTAPQFVLQRTDGNDVHFGTVLEESAAVVVKFWASWCPVCWVDLLKASETYEGLRAKGVEVLAVAVDRPEDVDFFLANQPVPYPVLLDEDGGVAKRFGVQALPTTIFINKEGKVIESHPGLSPDLESPLSMLPALRSAPLEPDP